ncbi:putative DNA helicase [Helianthus anomalus]
MLALISGLHITISHIQDMNSVCSNGCRIAKCMKEYFIYKKNYKGALNSILLAKSLHQKLWDDCPYLLKQLPGIGMVTAKALQSMGVKSFESLSEADPRKIEMVTGRKFPFGNHIKESLLSLPPKVDMKVEEIMCPNYGKSKLVVTLTRLSQSPQTKRHYADMVVAVEEDNLIVFHEKIRVEEFTSPYSATILVTSPLQGKLTVKADLIFEEFIGIDVHQKAILMKNIINYDIRHINATKKISLPQPTDVCIIDPECDYAPNVSADRPDKPSNSKNEEAFMPSFKLLDEDSDEGEPVIENNNDDDDDYAAAADDDNAAAVVDDDDDCKIVTERTVFDHIREKAKSLPSLAAKPTAEYPPSEETLSLIRKRTRDRQLAINDTEEFLDLTEGFNPCEESSEPDKHIRSKIPTGENIFEHIRKKAKSFPRIDEIRSISSKPSNTNFDFDLFADAKSNLIILDPEPVKPQRKEKSQKSPSLGNRQCCSLATAAETREGTDPFRGFKSVFSFL